MFSSKPVDALLEQLAKPELSLADVIRLTAELERSVESEPPPIRVGISASITADLVGTYLKRQLLLRGCASKITFGDYDSHHDNMSRFAAEGIECAVIAYLFDNLAPVFESSLLASAIQDVAAHRLRFENALHLALRAAEGIRQVIILDLHSMSRPSASLHSDGIETALADFNQSLYSIASQYTNVRVISSARALAAVGWDHAINLRNHHRYRAPYTTQFCDELSSHIARTIVGHQRIYKALVLDCDNTLWGGIIGEDMLDGIKLAPDEYPGVMYFQAQQVFAELQARGVVLCLCSKNNAADVDEVFERHRHMVLRREKIVASRVNWDEKSTNIQSLAQELNIGLDAMIFLDDSPFECEAVRSALPSVLVLQVPRSIHEYPALLDRLRHECLAGVDRVEGAEKTEQYRRRSLARQDEALFASQDEYLASLSIRTVIVRNEESRAARIAELSRKSNQFNVTTQRYSEADIRSLMESPASDVYSVHVSDRFGDSGLTGIVIVRHDGTRSSIDTFLMSCRVLGRGIESAIWPTLLAALVSRGCTELTATYRPTSKNAQVADFFDRLGFNHVAAGAAQHEYHCDLDSFVLPESPHIEIVHVF